MVCRIITELFCDECREDYNWDTGHSIRLMRRGAKKDGWVVKKTDGGLIDLCPNCKPKEENDDI